MPITPPTLAFLGNLGIPEMLMLGALGVLLFGKRLPEVGRSIGKGIVEFKKGLAGVDDEVNEAVERQRELDAHKATSRTLPADAATPLPTASASTASSTPTVLPASTPADPDQSRVEEPVAAGSAS